jgi:hypothetical protein
MTKKILSKLRVLEQNELEAQKSCPSPPYWEADYKENCPKSRALVVSDGTHARAIEYIGPDFEYWFAELGEYNMFDGTSPGVWICEIQTKEVKYWTDYGYEYDADYSCNERKLTDEEWEYFMNDELPWDSNDWLKNWDKRFPTNTEETSE